VTAGRITAAATAVAIAVGTVLSSAAAFAPAASASASRAPVIYNYAEGFLHGRVQPSHIYVGNGSGAPVVLRLHWTHWNQATASGRGVLDEQIPGCTLTPGYRCPHYQHSARVYLHRVRSHNGQPYYTRMRWTSHGKVTYWQSHRGYWS
jgi:hypothetical protein